MKKILISLFGLFCVPVYASTVVATINGTPITDTDITARIQLMARQGNTPMNNRRVALQNIIDDTVKLNYASNFGVSPLDKDVNNELAKMKLDGLSASERQIAKNAIRANIAWQIVIGRTILPLVDVSSADIQSEKSELAHQHGLPIEMEIIRLINIPQNVAQKLTKPSSCDDAEKMAKNLGGSPQRFTAVQYELASEIRDKVIDLPLLTWSERTAKDIYLVCSTKKTKEYGKLDDMIKENAKYKQAMFMAEQQLKQLRRKAVVVINDDRYKL
ncbi:MAG: hypothetical protein ACLRFI_02130 [Alphaproteobacteria bacterium]